MEKPTKIVDLLVEDLRFPTSLGLDGSDAIHPGKLLQINYKHDLKFIS